MTDKQVVTELIRAKYKNGFFQNEVIKDCSDTLSNVWNVLIERVGKLCDYYRSDLVYDIQTVMKYMNEKEDFSYLFGLRESGVDSYSFIQSRVGEHCYREMWRLDVTFIPEMYGRYDVSAQLYKIYEPTMTVCEKEELIEQYHEMLNEETLVY